MNAKLVFYLLGGMGLVSGAIMLISFKPLFDFILKKVIILFYILMKLNFFVDVQRNRYVQWAATKGQIISESI